MNFSEALGLLSSGGKVRRNSWSYGCYVFIKDLQDSERSEFCFLTRDLYGKASQAIYYLRTGDILSNDWEEYKYSEGNLEDGMILSETQAIEEMVELDDKIERLAAFLHKNENNTGDLAYQKMLMKEQLGHMHNYSMVIRKRISSMGEGGNGVTH